MTYTFDPDKFNLTKKDILKIMEAIGNRWSKSTTAKIKNMHYIAGLEAIKIGIRVTPEEIIQLIWKDILMGFNILIQENDKARMKEEFPDMKNLLDLTTKRIEDGTAFESN